MIFADAEVNGKLDNYNFKTTPRMYELMFEGDKVLIIATDTRYKDYMRAFDINLEGIKINSDEL